MKHIKYINDFLLEGRVVNFDNPNQGNFIIVMGGPGSGKSTISKNLINVRNVKHFNVDDEREMMARKMNLDLNVPENNDKILKITHGSSDSRNRTINLLKTYLKSKKKELTNIIFDTVGNHVELISNLIDLAHNQGYIVTMVYVKCSIEEALKRNSMRKRRLSDDTVIKYHKDVQDTYHILLPKYDNIWTVDNNGELDLIKRKDIVVKENKKSKKITDDKNEFVVKDFDAFIDQDEEIEKETTSRPVGRLPLISGQDVGKPIFNSSEQPNL